MNMNNIFLKILGVLAMLSLIASCDEDFGTLGTEIVGEVNFTTDLAEDFDIAAYTRNYENSVQSNAVPVGAIGFYDDPVYGTTTASLVSQLTLSRTNPDFGDDTELESVIFSLPYFATAGAVDDEGGTSYTLDSIFRNTGPMRLSAYRSSFFLNELDPESGFEEPQVYFSNEIENFPGIESELLFQIDDFEPSNEEIVIDAPTDDDPDAIERLSPRLRIDLKSLEEDEDLSSRPWLENVDFDWNAVILEQEGSDVLLNGNNFNDYFRGIYLKAESLDGTGSFIIVNLATANIEINYTFSGDDDSGDPGEATNDGVGSITLNLGGVQAINYDTDYSINPIGNPSFNDTQDVVNGEEQLYLKGGDGSIALIELFGEDINNDGLPEQLEDLRECGIIINEANLTFYVEQDALGSEGTGILEPERVFIYDFDNNRILADAPFDTSAGNDGPVSQRTNHLGRLSRTEEGNTSSPGVSYKILLTQHINNLIQNDSTNVRLALAVSQNVLLSNTSIIQEETTDLDEQRVPVSSVISPEGTVLHGNLSSDDTKRLRLQIRYTTTTEIDPNSPCGIALGL